MSACLVGLPALTNILSRAPYAALNSRDQIHLRLQAIIDAARYKALIEHAFKSAGCQHTSGVLEFATLLQGALPPVLGVAQRLWLHIRI